MGHIIQPVPKHRQIFQYTMITQVLQGLNKKKYGIQLLKLAFLINFRYTDCKIT